MIAKYVTPWKFRRQQAEQRIAALRARDGDNCRRCRRPVRFDLAPGHDKGPKVESFAPNVDSEEVPLDHLCICHGRCNAAGVDDTGEVVERIRRRGEAALFARSRRVKKAG